MGYATFMFTYKVPAWSPVTLSRRLHFNQLLPDAWNAFSMKA